MANVVKLKRSAVSGNVPSTSQLELGEVALNTFDGDLFFKKDNGTESIVSVVTTDGTQSLSNKTISDDLTITGSLILETDAEALDLSSGAAILDDQGADGSSGQLLSSTGSGVRWITNTSVSSTSETMDKYAFTATSGQTVFSGLDDNSNTLALTVGVEIVTLNGIVLEAGTDYTATTSSITLTAGASTGDELNVIAFGNFTVADVVSASSGGTFNGAVTFADAFTSRGIDDNATSTAMTLNSSGNVGIGTSSPSTKLGVYAGALGGTSGDRVDAFQLITTTTNADQLNFSKIREAAGENWTSAGWRIQQKVDFTNQGYVQFNGSGNEGGLSFGTDNAERMRIDNIGRVGIGTTSPSQKLTVSGNIALVGGGNMFSSDTSSTYSIAGGNAFNNGGSITFGGSTSGVIAGGLTFNTGTGATNSEAMRIDSSGNLLVGTTFSSPGGASRSGKITLVHAGGSTTNGINVTTTAASSRAVEFQYTGYGVTGFIATGTNTTNYSTSSDYRLKEDWVAVADASTRVNALKPVNFAWKIDGTRVDGFLAHELAEVVPEAVTGEKDAVDAEGNPEYQGIDQSKLVPLLTAALQEAIGRIETLEAEVSALKEVL